jgi:uncharacterized protein
VLANVAPVARPSLRPAQAFPFTTFVVKVVSRCNLNCSYCYMYNLADQTYRGQPAFMTPAIANALVSRIKSHSARHGVTWAHLILHGGEPLLMGKARVREWVTIVREGLRGSLTPYFSMQSNGTLLDPEWVDLLADLDVGIGISVDGPQPYHDEFRVDHMGRGSFDDVVAGIRLLQRHPRGRQIFTTVMGVVNTDIPPKELFDFWQFLDVDGFDLSLPHANYLHPPRQGRMSYGAWMIELFDLWFDQNRRDRHIRYFENMLRMLFRYPLSTDNIGGRPVGVVVVETDGGIEPTDAFKCCEDGLTKLGLNVARNEFDDMYTFPMVGVLQTGAPRLCDACQACPVRDVCGGGYMPHRYRRENGFDNPSVYCADLLALTNHIRERVVEVIPEPLMAKLS